MIMKIQADIWNYMHPTTSYITVNSYEHVHRGLYSNTNAVTSDFWVCYNFQQYLQYFIPKFL